MGWTEKQEDSQIDEANKIMCETKIILKQTDYFNYITPNERLRDSLVPWQCRAAVSANQF
jgi:hypothetical protein